MKRAITISVFLVVLTAAWAAAQEPPTQPPAAPGIQAQNETSAEADVPVFPKREVNFDISEETLRVTIETKPLASNTTLQQLRYVGRVDVLFEHHPKLPEDLQPFGVYERIFGRRCGQPEFSVGRKPLDPLVAWLPEQHALPQELLSGLLSHGRLLDFTGEYVGKTHEKKLSLQASFEVLAASPERVKELVRGLLILLDYGFYRPLHQAQLDYLKKRERDLAKNHDKYEAAQASQIKWKSKLDEQAEYSDIDIESLRSLITQQRMIAVDLAGVTARLEACAKLLLGETPGSPKRGRVEELKVTAEIELVGLSAKKTAIDAIVKGARTREEARKALDTAGASWGQANVDVGRAKSQLEAAQKIVDESTLLELMGDVVIRQIEWAPVETKRSPGSSQKWWE